MSMEITTLAIFIGIAAIWILVARYYRDKAYLEGLEKGVTAGGPSDALFSIGSKNYYIRVHEKFWLAFRVGDLTLPDGFVNEVRDVIKQHFPDGGDIVSIHGPLEFTKHSIMGDHLVYDTKEQNEE